MYCAKPAPLRARLVPGDAQLVTRFYRGPEAVSINRDARRDLPHVDHTTDRARIGRVETGDARTKARRARDDDGEHSALADVERELRLAMRLGLGVELFH